jgi:hypothetical protein
MELYFHFILLHGMVPKHKVSFILMYMVFAAESEETLVSKLHHEIN